jgi:probable F420-dependent oxidoreductase
MSADPVGFARLAEELGFDSVWVSDHVLPTAATSQFGRNIEAMSVLAAIAAVTNRVRIGTSVIVVPLREPVLLAKQVATIDLISGGRLTFGVGAGWVEGEFANLGVDFRTRGARTDEFIRLLRHLFTGSNEPFEGRFTNLTDYLFAPIPPQGSALPVLVGGHSEGAIRRAARIADLYQPTFVPPEEFGRLRAAVLAQAGDRKVGFGVRTAVPADQPLEEFVELIRAFGAEGAEEVLIGFAGASDPAMQMREVAEKVLPAFG